MACKKRIRPNHQNGFSLIELIIAVAAAMILILGMGIMLAHSQQGFTRMFKRAHSDVVEDAYSARRVFDRFVRKSTMRRCDLINGSEIYVYYYSDKPQSPNLTLSDPDSFARFYVASGMLFVDYAEGVISPGEFDTLDPGSLSASSSVRLARDVQIVAGCPIFSVRARTVRMAMLLDNGKESMVVASSGVRHNR
ncbi:MAG: prepilin-type N-terminal cleavage/methylation domain-containing protein [Sedimentisphaerales bacterium]|nr:prepilin-type N-terminal cleavage/methylation domain-containing protein [Sedimentisphaerales bacterium]